MSYVHVIDSQVVKHYDVQYKDIQFEGGHMSVLQLKEKIPDFAKDIRLNLSSLFSQKDQMALSVTQFYGVALSVAYALKNEKIVDHLIEDGHEHISHELINGAKTAVCLMAMNNIYYRFIHLVDDEDFAKMPAGLRMNSMRNTGVSQIDFELFALAVSAINGCGLCIDSHVKALIKHGVDKVAIQQAIRLAAVLNAVDTSMVMND